MSLHPLHVEDLRRSGLADATIEMMRVSSVRPADINKLCLGGLPGVESVLEFPYPGVADFSRYKLFPALGNMKYFQTKDTGSHLYILSSVARVLGDFNRKLYFVEGEKKTAAALQAGLSAIGISGIWNWKAKDTWKGTQELQSIPFADREVEIVPDSDTWARDDLQQAVYAFAKYLEFRGAKVSVCLIPQPTDSKVGLDDYLLNRAAEDFHSLKRINLKHPALSQHKEWYESWKDKHEVKTADDGLQGKPVILADIEPWTDPVDGPAMLIELCRVIRRYVVMKTEDVVAVALWCVHAHVIDAFAISPFLNLVSPQSQCGKTTAMTIVARLVPRPVLSGNMSPSSVFRSIEKYKPSFLIDEADSFEKINEELRGLLNSSHLRDSATVIRTIGDEHEPRLFSTWCPKAVALIGRLPETLDNRSIVIEMRRRNQDEYCERFSSIEPHPELDTLARKVARWATDNFDAIRRAAPRAPEGIDLRIYDNWMPLLSIADVAGGEWPRWVRIAAAVFAARNIDPPSIKVELLKDIWEVMGERDQMTSEDLVKALGDMADRPWPTWKYGKPITQIQVSRLLKGFGIRPQNIRIGDKVPKGYYAQRLR